jgi:hypothetical protein
MHSHHLKDMAAALVAAGVIAPVVEARAREVLASHWVDKIAIVWTTADVRETVSQALSDAEAAEVLQKVLRDADADRGVTWDSLQSAANELFPDHTKRANCA